MNTWIWRLKIDDIATAQELHFVHGTKTVTFPRELFITIPRFLSDCDVAHLKAAQHERYRRVAAHQTP